MLNPVLENKKYQSKLVVQLKIIKVDVGSEFQDSFLDECQRRGINLFVLETRSPKLNGHVERVQRTHTEEFYEVTGTGFEIAELNQA
jgi:hypothetical protein